MKLFLCGGGSGKQILNALYKFSNILNKNKPILYIPLAMENNKYDSCYNWFENEINIINLDKFEIVKSSYELSKKDLDNYSALFIGGGNTYKLLSELKQYDNYNKIKKYLKGGGVVFCGSAGAINQSNRVMYKDDFDNFIMKDYAGLGLVNINIFPHVELENQSLLEETKEISKDMPLILLPNDSFIRIKNGNMEIVGESYKLYKEKFVQEL